MRSFQQYLENIRTWNTKNPQADINVTADYSDDENDVSHFLLPFMRKMKAFEEYCRVAVAELQGGYPFHYSRHQQDFHPVVRQTGRTAALHHMVGGTGEDQGPQHPLSALLKFMITDLGSLRNQFRKIPLNRQSIMYYASQVRASICRVLGSRHRTFTADDEHYANQERVARIMSRMERMEEFMNAVIPQLERVLNIGTK